MADEVRREWFDKDYYAVLGVPKNASAAEVKKAYRKLAQQHHPDTKQGDPDAENRFKEISAAYDVLGDAEKRKAYDQVREMSASGFGPGFGRPGPGGLAGPPEPGSAGWRAVRAGQRRRHRRSVRRPLRRGGATERPPPRRAAGRGSGDVRSRSRSRTRGGDDRADQDRRPGRVRPLSRIGCRTGNGADHLSTVRRQRRDRGEPGVLLDVTAVPRCGGAGTDRRVPVHQVRRVRRGAPDPHAAR